MSVGAIAFVAFLAGTGALAVVSVRAWRRGESPPDITSQLPPEALPVWSIGSFVGLAFMAIPLLAGNSPSTLTWIGTAFLGAAFLLASSIAWFNRPQALIPPVLRKEPRFKAERAERHRASVMHVRDPRPGGEQYYVPQCTCGWMGDDHQTAEPAFEEARRHTPNVDVHLERPLG